MRDLLADLSARSSGDIAWKSINCSWPHVASLSENIRFSWSRRRYPRVQYQADNPIETLAVIAAFSILPAELEIRPPWLQSNEFNVGCQLTVDHWNPIFEVDKTNECDESQMSPRLTLFSSGSTGRPHPTTWRWDEVSVWASQSQTVRGGKWLCAYPPSTFAGLQALFFAIIGCGSLTLLGPSDSLSGSLDAANEFQLSMSTPSFWRRVLLTEKSSLRRLRFETISMGGEIVDNALIRKLKENFPLARIRHVYASSDLGSLFCVSDERAGFPATWLNERRTGGIQLAIREGVLWISKGETADWRSTGDVVKVVGDRVLFKGRVADIINVAGQKVSSRAVEEAIRTMEEVCEVRAYAYPNSVTGEIVAADIVLNDPSSQEDIEFRLRRHLMRELPAHAVPRRIRFVPTIHFANSGKVKMNKEEMP